LSTAILAVLAAITGLLSGMHANEAMMDQIEASDQWNYYQAKSIKASVLDAKMSLAPRQMKKIGKSRKIRGGTIENSIGSRAQTIRGEIQFSST
jgi:hypothetical protein